MKHGNALKRSPFFYVGDKYKLLSKIGKYFPEKIESFIEPFVGGGSVFLNINAKYYLLNDIDTNVVLLHKFLTRNAGKEKAFLRKVKILAEKYNLSRSVFEDVVPTSLKKKWVKTYYAEFNRKGYGQMKADYNKAKKKDPLVLYLLLIYGFNRILRFNKRGEFNIPVGNVDLNQNVIRALHDYFSHVQKRDISFYNQDFRKFIAQRKFAKNDFVYVDPPYLISASEYNKLWSPTEERELLKLLDELDSRGVRFALSNITAYNGRENDLLIRWARNYNVHPVESNYISYHNNSRKNITEILVTNY